MIWLESGDAEVYRVPDDVVDVSFRIDCRELPADHAHALAVAVAAALPWYDHEPEAALHLIHGAESGNGWTRPADTDNEILLLSRRTRFMLRVPRHRVEASLALAGRRLEVAGFHLTIGAGRVRRLSPSTTLFARHVASEGGAEEDGFVEEVLGELATLGVTVRKLLCGRARRLATPEGGFPTRSLMLAELEVADAVRLQQRGIGARRKLGCGVLVPHKSIAAVGESSDTA